MDSIKIIPSYFKQSLVHAQQQQWRTLEHYLEKNTRTFEFNDADKYVTVEVIDINDAKHLANACNLSKVEYVAFDGKTSFLEISTQINKGGRPKNTVFVKELDKCMTLNQYKKHLKNTTVSKADVVKQGIMTKGELEKAIAAGHLQVLMIGSSKRIDHNQLQKFIS
jgi:hypothetical protein